MQILNRIPRHLWLFLVIAAGLLLLAYALIRGNLGASLLVSDSDHLPPSRPRIAHAGGAIANQTYTNSVAALNINAAHYNLFELDFNFTADGYLVCTHNWAAPPTKPPTLHQFLLDQAHAAYPKCTIGTVITWLDAHPGKRIVTDVKDDNIKALSYIARHYPAYINRFIPQIYFPHEYLPVRTLGYRDIIWTLYRYRWGGIFVLSNLRSMHLYAVTMPLKRAYALPPLLNRMGIASYVHTIDAPAQWAELKHAGVAEIYTDTLVEK
ncbi:MAG: hypothetical protein WCD42_08355 [Rhizomicrobium sp.]